MSARDERRWQPGDVDAGEGCGPPPRGYGPPPGYPPPPRRRRRWLFVVVGLVALLLIFVAFAPSRPSSPVLSPTVGATGPGTATAPTPQDPAVDTSAGVHRYGEGVDVHGLVVVVKAPAAGSSAVGGPTTCTVVSYRNGTKEPMLFGLLDWRRRDSNGAEVPPTFTGAKKLLDTGTLTPGGSATGAVCFEGPPDAVAAIVFMGNPFGGGEVVAWQK